MKKTVKIICGALAGVLAASALAGCGKKEASDGKIHITIGNWPVESDKSYELKQKRLAEFNEAHPDIVAEGVPFIYDTKTFSAKAAAKQLPTSYDTWFTEIDQLSQQGYCRDISKLVKEAGLYDVYNPTLLDMAKGKNGEIWGLPHDAYAQGLYINKKLFKDAGLVNEDGTIKVPDTYEELAEYAGIIKEKTGTAGFVIPTTDNCGGWNMMNIAWSYGADFMEKDKDGKWKATFDSPEFKEACKWVYDMKWKYNAFYEQSAITNGDREQIFGTYQAGMMFSNPPAGNLVKKFGMKIEDIACYRMPEGPAGRYSQTGGGIVMFSPEATDEEVMASLKWYIEQGGWVIEITDESLAKSEENLKLNVEQGNISIPVDAFKRFTKRPRQDEADALAEKYSNVDMNDYNSYFGFEDVTLRAEEPVCCQQLYAVIDGIIQKIITNKDVDIDAAVKEAVNDFQKNHLDNL